MDREGREVITKGDMMDSNEQDRRDMRAVWEKDRAYATSTAGAWDRLADMLAEQSEILHNITRSVHSPCPDEWSYTWAYPNGGVEVDTIREQMCALMASAYAMSGAYRRLAWKLQGALDLDAEEPAANVAASHGAPF